MPRGRKKRNQTVEQETIVLPGPAPDALLDVDGAACWFGMGRTKFFELMRDEEDFPVIRISERVLRFDINSLYKWALSRQVSGS